MRTVFSLFFILSVTVATAQYEYDDVLFKTVDVKELCKELEKNKGYLLLDVRSKGEHEDTSSFASLNIGRMKNATNISVQELSTRWKELEAYKDRPVFIYCSHSQRSRRASRLLADSGFTRVFNINGGMTAIHASQDDCTQSLLSSAKSYSMISAPALCALMKKRDDVFILDVRTDSAWNRISRNERDNAMGYLRGAVHIPRSELATNLDRIPRDKKIIITDVGGYEPAMAAILLTKLGYPDVSVLLEGIDRFMLVNEKDLPCKKDIYVSSAPYRVINVYAFPEYHDKNKGARILDIRSKEEFSNTHKDDFRNTGRLKEAVNIPVSELKERLADIPGDKSKPVIVYAFSGGPESYQAAKILHEAGYSNVTVLMGGIFSLRWTAANDKSQAGLKGWIVNSDSE